MAFTVEDGTGVEDANSYVTESEADAYHEDRGNTAWETTTAEKEPILVRASAAIDALYGDMFPGERTFGRDQGLEWPRADENELDGLVTDRDGESIGDDEIPVEIKQAVFELALREVATPGSAIPDVSRLKKRIKAGSVEIEYGDGQPFTTEFQIVDGILRRLIGGGPSSTSSSLSGEVVRG